MVRAEAHEVVRSVGWLSKQPGRFIEAILAAAKIIDIAPGGQIYSLDDSTGGLFGIASGHVDVLIAPGPFPPMLVHIGSPGWWVGEAALITRTRRRAELRARDLVQVLFLSEAHIETVAADDPLTWRRLAEISVSHLDDALSLAACLGAKNYTRRLAMTLLRLAGPMIENAITISIPIAQDELAELAGLSRNSVVRSLRPLRQMGAVETLYGQIAIYPDRLRAALLTGMTD